MYITINSCTITPATKKDGATITITGQDLTEILTAENIREDFEPKTYSFIFHCDKKSEILNVDIDPNSFQMYEEKNGLWSKFNINDYNKSLIEFEEAGKKKALEKGIIEKADESAKKMVESFVNSLIDSDEYTIEYKTK